VSSIYLDADGGNDDWLVSNITISISSYDDTSGVDHTRYRLNEGDWQSYSDEFMIEGSGYFTIEYFSVDMAGNEETTQNRSFRIDLDNPSTQATIKGTIGDANWYTTNVSFELSSFDQTSSAGDIKFCLDGGDWRSYIGDTTINEDGTHQIVFYSIDEAGNEGDIENLSFKMDKKPPRTVSTPEGVEGMNGWFITEVSIVMNASDETSGVGSISYRINNAEWKTYSHRINLIEDGVFIIDYFSRDIAGNVEGISKLEVKIDRTGPDLYIISPEYGEESNRTWCVIEIILDDLMSGAHRVEIMWDDGSIMDIGRNTTFNITDLLEGVHHIHLSGLDYAGNRKELSFIHIVNLTRPSEQVTTNQTMNSETNGTMNETMNGTSKEVDIKLIIALIVTVSSLLLIACSVSILLLWKKDYRDHGPIEAVPDENEDPTNVQVPDDNSSKRSSNVHEQEDREIQGPN